MVHDHLSHTHESPRSDRNASPNSASCDVARTTSAAGAAGGPSASGPKEIRGRKNLERGNMTTSSAAEENHDDHSASKSDEWWSASISAGPRRRAAAMVPPIASAAQVPAFNFSFALGGWLMIYNFGVAKCLLDHGLHKVDPRRQSVIGSSAGSLAAAALVLEADIDKIVDQIKTNFIPRAHAAKLFGFVYGIFFIGMFLQQSMLECLPVERVPEKTSTPGRLIIVMTSLVSWRSVRAREYKDGGELFDAMRCSCAAFPLVLPYWYRRRRCFDGFFSEGTSPPALNEEEAQGLKTVTISPLYASSADIRPSRYVPLSWIALAPKDPSAIDWLYDLGYRDALFWMAKEGVEHTCSHGSKFASEAEGSACGDVGDGGAISAARAAHTSGKADAAFYSTNLDSDNARDENADGDHDPGTLGREANVERSGQEGANVLGGAPPEATRPSTQPWPDEYLMSHPESSGRNDNVDFDFDTHRVNRSDDRTFVDEHLDICQLTRTDGSGPGHTKEEHNKQLRQRRECKRDSHAQQHYLRASFKLSGCEMRPQRRRHSKLDAPAFVPSLQGLVGHGSYHAALDFAFVMFFTVVWRPMAALLLYVDLVIRLTVAVSRGVGKELRAILWWLAPTILLGIWVVAVAEDEAGDNYLGTSGGFTRVRGIGVESGFVKGEGASRSESADGRQKPRLGLALAVMVAAIIAARARRDGALSEGEWRKARRCVQGLLDYRILMRCLPWGHRDNARSEELETSSFLYRMVSFFM